MAEPQFACINGELIPKEQAFVPLYDHGMLYGDGLFEGIRVYNNRVFKLDEHVARLYYSAKALNIELKVDQATLRKSIVETVKANGHRNGYIRVTVTRGVGLGLDPKHMKSGANVYISCEQLALYPQEMYENGLIVVTVSTRLPSPDVIDPRVKCTGKYINNIMAKAEANRYGAGEGLMLTREGYVGEATGDNIFLIKNGAITTPPASIGILQGITRDTVIELAKAVGLAVSEPIITQYDVYNADEVFLTGTAAEVIPAVEFDGRKIGDGKPGPITRQLIAAYREHTQTTGTPVE
ncbi:branched chain amino acid aminotransferase [Capsulimonas corticalis]|uniref:Branched-chain-amino-acid aminotransferase n=1 Tax=Capsulimonas corticalis TaxID=2219043 RepID=A0A402CYE9_9BACT|nr:branched-chain-amino-acid transaminase [Capsulimonas corticalis]BDI31370.1 branched chain amino acid aminotransferase [Capsulimonas corticalis]